MRVLILVVLALAGCGGESRGQKASAGPSPTTTKPPVPEPTPAERCEALAADETVPPCDAVDCFLALGDTGSDSGVPPGPAVPTDCPGSQELPSDVPAAAAAAPLVGPVPDEISFDLSIGLPARHDDLLTRTADHVSDPADVCYMRYLTPEQTTLVFGPTENDHAKVVAFAEANGFTIVQTFPNRMAVSVRGSAGVVDRALCLTLNYYSRPDGSQFYAPDRAPSLDLDVPLLGISGLDDYYPTLTGPPSPIPKP